MTITGRDIHEFALSSPEMPKDAGFKDYLETHSQRFARLFNDLRVIGSRGRILDVGSGAYMGYMLRHFCEVSEYESPQNVDLEIDNWASQFKGRFDLVICTEVIEHMSADSAYLVHQCARSLRLGGALYLTTVNIARLLSIYNICHGETPYSMGGLFGRRTDRHQREYAPRETAELVSAQGFDVRFTTADCYAKPDFVAEKEEWACKNISGLDHRLHGDTIIVHGTKTLEVPEPVRTWPIFHHSVSANKAWSSAADSQRVKMVDRLFD